MSPRNLLGGVCPRCGAPFSYIRELKRGNNEYLYAVHAYGKKKSYCYLGPADSYIYAEEFNELALSGLANPLRYLHYVSHAASQLLLGSPEDLSGRVDPEALRSEIRRAVHEKTDASEQARALLEAVRRLREIAKNVAALCNVAEEEVLKRLEELREIEREEQRAEEEEREALVAIAKPRRKRGR